MNFLRFSCCCILLAGALTTVSGCGGNSSTGAVTGTVTLDGEPLADAVVSFNPATGRASAGKTNSEGKYQLRYIKNEMGAVIGEHVVTFTVVPEETDERANAKPSYSPDGDAAAASVRSVKQAKSPLPSRYSSKESSGQTATVVAGSNTIDFDLTSK